MIKHPFDIPESKKVRLIINTDAKNEADDQYAIVHALLTHALRLLELPQPTLELAGRIIRWKKAMTRSLKCWS